MSSFSLSKGQTAKGPFMFVQVIEAWGLQGLAFRYKAKT